MTLEFLQPLRFFRSLRSQVDRQKAKRMRPSRRDGHERKARSSMLPALWKTWNANKPDQNKSREVLQREAGGHPTSDLVAVCPGWPAVFAGHARLGQGRPAPRRVGRFGVRAGHHWCAVGVSTSPSFDVGLDLSGFLVSHSVLLSGLHGKPSAGDRLSGGHDRPDDLGRRSFPGAGSCGWLVRRVRGHLFGLPSYERKLRGLLRQCSGVRDRLRLGGVGRFHEGIPPAIRHRQAGGGGAAIASERGILQKPVHPQFVHHVADRYAKRGDPGRE